MECIIRAQYSCLSVYKEQLKEYFIKQVEGDFGQIYYIISIDLNDLPTLAAALKCSIEVKPIGNSIDNWVINTYNIKCILIIIEGVML